MVAFVGVVGPVRGGRSVAPVRFWATFIVDVSESSFACCEDANDDTVVSGPCPVRPDVGRSCPRVLLSR
jgi:hypothetical protein